jgi:hypothetical protein
MNIISHPLSYYVDLLKENKPFCFVRYGDGEWLTILGFYGLHNSNGCTFTRELSEDLRAVLKRQNPYYHAILKVAKRERDVNFNGGLVPYGLSSISKFLDDNKIGLYWYNGDVLLNANLEGKLWPLIEQIRKRRILYIGNERLRGLNGRGVGLFDFITYIQVPPQNTHSIKAQLVETVKTFIPKYKIDFIGWSAGLASKVFIDEVFMAYPDVTQIDFGSTFDAFFDPLPHIKAMGRNGSRSYIRNGGYDWSKLLKQNKGEQVE